MFRDVVFLTKRLSERVKSTENAMMMRMGERKRDESSIHDNITPSD